jgi:hypothetical protein
MREDKKVLGTSKESSLLQTANSFYKSFADQLVTSSQCRTHGAAVVLGVLEHFLQLAKEDLDVHYFSIPRDESGSSEPQMLVVSDLDEPFLPIPGDLMRSRLSWMVRAVVAKRPLVTEA